VHSEQGRPSLPFADWFHHDEEGRFMRPSYAKTEVFSNGFSNDSMAPPKPLSVTYRTQQHLMRWRTRLTIDQSRAKSKLQVDETFRGAEN